MGRYSRTHYGPGWTRYGPGWGVGGALGRAKVFQLNNTLFSEMSAQEMAESECRSAEARYAFLEYR